MPHTIGTKTRTAITYGPESHKLFLEFGKDDAQTIEPGMAVVMDAANPGQVLPAPAGQVRDQIVGYAITGGNHTAYGDGLVTVACRGYMVVKGIATQAVVPGAVELDTPTAEGIPTYIPSTDPTKTIGIAITGAAVDGELSVMLL
jgi:hypothetical protein